MKVMILAAGEIVEEGCGERRSKTRKIELYDRISVDRHAQNVDTQIMG